MAYALAGRLQCASSASACSLRSLAESLKSSTVLFGDGPIAAGTEEFAAEDPVLRDLRAPLPEPIVVQLGQRVCHG